MGEVTVAEVIRLLSEGGIRGETAFPAQRITRVTEPVAAVSLGEVDQEKGTVTVQVDIVGPKEKGGYVCQSRALEACRILAEAGAVCRQGSCSFLNKSNLFRVQIRAVFTQREPFTIQAGQWLLSNACGYSSEMKRSGEDIHWEVTVEEFIPWGMPDTLEQEEPFALNIHCRDYVEHFGGCRWIHKQRVPEANGIRQFSTAAASNRGYTTE